MLGSGDNNLYVFLLTGQHLLDEHSLQSSCLLLVTTQILVNTAAKHLLEKEAWHCDLLLYTCSDVKLSYWPMARMLLHAVG